MISISNGVEYFDQLVRAEDKCEDLRRAIETVRQAYAAEPDNGLDFYAVMVPVVELGNLESIRHGDGRKTLVQAYDEQSGSRFRVNEITTALAAGFLLPAETHELTHLNVHSILDVASGLMLVTATRSVLDKAGRTRRVESQPFLVPVNLLVQTETYEKAGHAMKAIPRNDRHRPLTAAARFHMATQTAEDEFETGLSFLTKSMADARAELAADLAEHNEAEDKDTMTLYEFDLVEWQMVLTTVLFSYYTLYAQAGDVEQKGYDASTWRNTMFNIYEGGVVEAIFDDLLHLVVEQPEDSVARCHNIVSRVRSIQNGINEIYQMYDTLADGVDKPVIH